MDSTTLDQLLRDVSSGAVAPAEAARKLRRLPFADLGYAKVDHHRPLRQGIAEAVYAPGKTPEQCAAIVEELLSEPGGPVLMTRADEAQVAAATGANPGGVRTGSTVAWRQDPPRSARVVVTVAGTADQPVADECRATLEAHGLYPVVLADCGVAGVHRLLSSGEVLASAEAVVVVAGMEGALASLVAGLVAAPVVAVPTSTGYGASLAGVTALLAMLASCVPGVAVVGIDNGFGAACALVRMLR